MLMRSAMFFVCVMMVLLFCWWSYTFNVCLPSLCRVSVGCGASDISVRYALQRRTAYTPHSHATNHRIMLQSKQCKIAHKTVSLHHQLKHAQSETATRFRPGIDMLACRQHCSGSDPGSWSVCNRARRAETLVKPAAAAAAGCCFALCI